MNPLSVNIPQQFKGYLNCYNISAASMNGAAVSVCHLHHTVPHYGSAVLVALLKFLGNLILPLSLILNMHHCIVHIRVELLPHCLDHLHPGILQSL